MLLTEDFLLTTRTARTLFHEYVATLPIIDYHCHLVPQEIAEDRNFSGIVEAWLGGHGYGDHYKWRLMRANGVPESHITGDAPDWEKFRAFAATMERAVGNPVYLWTHLELRRIFGIEEDLTSDSARSIFERTNDLLATPEFSRRSLIRRFDVEVVCTTDDPVDDLHYHRSLAAETDFRVVPAFRPDHALAIDRPGFQGWLTTLEEVTGARLDTFAALGDALGSRIDYFHDLGARMADLAVDRVAYEDAAEADLDAILRRAREGGPVTPAEVVRYRSGLIRDLAHRFRAKGWTMQMHLHAARDLNRAGFALHGADTGFDAIGDGGVVEPLARLFDSLDAEDGLPQTIVYSLNPTDWLPLTALIGCFQGGTRQRLQLGAAWWFNDTVSGIRSQLEVMAEQSLVGNFIGMTTDSRSFLSYPRHEFFRRILCQLLGEWSERGQITDDVAALGALAQDVSYHNAKARFAD